MPNKADADPVVHADAVLALSIPAQGLETVPGEDRQVSQFVSGVQLAQLALGRARDGLKAAAGQAVEQSLGFLRSKRPDH